LCGVVWCCVVLCGVVWCCVVLCVCCVCVVYGCFLYVRSFVHIFIFTKKKQFFETLHCGKENTIICLLHAMTIYTTEGQLLDLLFSSPSRPNELDSLLKAVERWLFSSPSSLSLRAQASLMTLLMEEFPSNLMVCCVMWECDVGV
jgi:hypothetical protein